MFTSPKTLLTYLTLFTATLASPQILKRDEPKYELQCFNNNPSIYPPDLSTCAATAPITECCQTIETISCDSKGHVVRPSGRSGTSLCQDRLCGCPYRREALGLDATAGPPTGAPVNEGEKGTLQECRDYNTRRKANPLFADANPEKDCAGLV